MYEETNYFCSYRAQIHPSGALLDFSWRRNWSCESTTCHDPFIYTARSDISASNAKTSRLKEHSICFVIVIVLFQNGGGGLEFEKSNFRSRWWRHWRAFPTTTHWVALRFKWTCTRRRCAAVWILLFVFCLKYQKKTMKHTVFWRWKIASGL